MESVHSVYLRELMPLTQIHTMMRASHYRWPWFQRKSAFTKRAYKGTQLIWCTDKQYLLCEFDTFRHELLQYGAEQIHLGTLRYDSGDVNARRIQMWHEVVLDVDLTDFTRYCDCVRQTDTKRACPQCWLHIEGMQLLIRYILCYKLAVEERYLLWVFSGKKGVHCLCNDPRLCRTDAQARDRLIGLLRCETLDDLWDLAIELPMDVANQINVLFENRAIQHRALLDVVEFRKHCLTIVRQYFPALYNILNQRWSNSKGSVNDWTVLKTLQQDQCDSVTPTLLIALTVFYPRVDSGPLRLSHKFKMPFSVHGDTQRLALPMQCDALISDTLPTGALTLSELVSQYRLNGECTQYTESLRVFENWLQHYV
jgi:DNA primase catalytic subunit